MQGLLGEENALAVHGTLLHMINHSMIKLVLFMAAGVIFMNAHALDLNEIRGFGKRKPLLKGIFLIGALAIAGIPLFGGYISKTLLHESIVEFGGGGLMRAVEYIFLFSGGLTVAYMTKLYTAIFIEENDNYNEEQKTNSSKDEIFKEDSSLIINNTNINQQVGNIIVVEIKGEVINPDVYSLNEGSIIKDLIEAAGGLTNEADISNINRAKEINNHELIVIRNINDSVSNENIEINEIQEIEIDDGKININTADLNRLKDIPGIGDVKANSIIMYREENGGFKTIDELKNVDGIGEKTFEKIKNNIKI